MTFSLLLLNEFPDEEADRVGGRMNLVLLLGRHRAAQLYAAFALMVPVSVMAGIGAKYLPVLAAIAIIPSLVFLVKPVGWALREPKEPVPVPALGANVFWNLTTNLALGIALFIAAAL
jgi:1,4-dihydroxy-2-naphthoate octaprenyltransferase